MVDFRILAHLTIFANYHHFIIAEAYNLNVPADQALQFGQREMLAIWWRYLCHAP